MCVYFYLTCAVKSTLVFRSSTWAMRNFERIKRCACWLPRSWCHDVIVSWSILSGKDHVARTKKWLCLMLWNASEKSYWVYMEFLLLFIVKWVLLFGKKVFLWNLMNIGNCLPYTGKGFYRKLLWGQKSDYFNSRIFQVSFSFLIYKFFLFKLNHFS